MSTIRAESNDEPMVNRINWNSYLKYDDGKLYWLNNMGNHIKAGDEAGSFDKDGYKRIQISKKTYRAHQIVYNMHYGPIPNGLIVDHINSVPDDNRIENLQLVTPQQNQLRRTDGKGYSLEKGKYRAHRGFAGKVYRLGYFGSPGGAYMASRMFFINKGENE